MDKFKDFIKVIILGVAGFLALNPTTMHLAILGITLVMSLDIYEEGQK